MKPSIFFLVVSITVLLFCTFNACDSDSSITYTSETYPAVWKNWAGVEYDTIENTSEDLLEFSMTQINDSVIFGGFNHGVSSALVRDSVVGSINTKGEINLFSISYKVINGPLISGWFAHHFEGELRTYNDTLKGTWNAGNGAGTFVLVKIK